MDQSIAKNSSSGATNDRTDASNAIHTPDTPAGESTNAKSNEILKDEQATGEKVAESSSEASNSSGAGEQSAASEKLTNDVESKSGTNETHTSAHKKRRPYLVVLPAGDTSLHTDPTALWLEPAATRLFDFHIIYYGTDETKASEYEKHADSFERREGPKWQLIRHIVAAKAWQEYRYIWFPDDDLRIPGGADTINRLFQISDVHNLQLSQPGLEDINVQPSYKALLVARPRCLLHYTNFVEIMCPLFSVAALSHVAYTLDDEKVKSGWGLDILWPILLGFADIGVVDAAVVVHTRPPNAFAVGNSFYEKYKIDPQRECYDLMIKYRFKEFQQGAFQEVMLPSGGWVPPPSPPTAPQQEQPHQSGALERGQPNDGDHRAGQWDNGGSHAHRAHDATYNDYSDYEYQQHYHQQQYHQQYQQRGNREEYGRVDRRTDRNRGERDERRRRDRGEHSDRDRDRDY